MHPQIVTYSEMKQMFFKSLIKLFLQNPKSNHFIHFCMNINKLQENTYFTWVSWNLPTWKKHELKNTEMTWKTRFHERPEKNKSEFGYDTKGGGKYVEAAFNSFSITDKQLILNLAPQLSKHIKEVPPLNWYPTVLNSCWKTKVLVNFCWNYFPQWKKTRT